MQAAEVTICYSPQLFLSLRFLAMVVRGLVAVGRCHGARSSPGRRLLAVGGSVPALGAVHSDSEDVAVALVGRSGEEKGGERDEPSSASQAQVHTNTSVTPSLPQPTPRA